MAAGRTPQITVRPLYESGRLQVGSQEIVRWRNESVERRRQIALLEAFQDAGWPIWIANPFEAEDVARDTCKNLNRKLKRWLHFTASFDRVYWTDICTTSSV